MRGLVLEVRPSLAECLSETFRNEYRIIAKAGGASDLSRHRPSNCPSEDLGETSMEATAIEV